MTDIHALLTALVGARFRDLSATPEARARLAAYLDRLETSRSCDDAMRAFIAESRAALVAASPTTTTHLEVA